MTQHIPLLVPGAKPEGKIVTITAPFDGSNIATIETTGIDGAHTALETAHGLFRGQRRAFQVHRGGVQGRWGGRRALGWPNTRRAAERDPGDTRANVTPWRRSSSTMVLAWAMLGLG